MGLTWKNRFVAYRKATSWVVIVAVVGSLSLAKTAVAADKLAVISIKPVNQLFSDIEYLLRATGTEMLGQFFLPSARAFTQGIDGTKPIGVIVTVEEDAFNTLGFVPVTDLKMVLTNLEQPLGRATDAGDGVLELQGPQPVFIKEQAGWAFIGQSVQSLKSLPNDPADLLGDMPKRFDIGVTAFVKNLPAAYQELAISQMRAGIERTMSDDPAGADAQIEQLTKAIKESDTVGFGWQIDPEQRETHLELTMKPVAGTEMAQQVESMQTAKTGFGGFLVKDAAIHGNLTSVILPGQIQQAIASLKRLQAATLKEIDEDDDLDDGTRAATKQLVQTFFRIGESTVKTGSIDSCTSVILNPKAMTILSAGHVADGKEVEAAVRQLVEAAKNQPDLKFSSVKFNVTKHAGVDFHSLALPIPEDEYVHKVLGETLEVTIGTAASSAYVAIGTDGMEQLKRQIDSSQQTGQTTVDPFYGEVALIPVLKFAESIEPNPMIRSFAAMLEDTPDRVHVRASASDDSAAYRLTIQEGVLGAIGQGVAAVGLNNAN